MGLRTWTENTPIETRENERFIMHEIHFIPQDVPNVIKLLKRTESTVAPIFQKIIEGFAIKKLGILKKFEVTTFTKMYMRETENIIENSGGYLSSELKKTPRIKFQPLKWWIISFLMLYWGFYGILDTERKSWKSSNLDTKERTFPLSQAVWQREPSVSVKIEKKKGVFDFRLHEGTEIKKNGTKISVIRILWDLEGRLIQSRPIIFTLKISKSWTNVNTGIH